MGAMWVGRMDALTVACLAVRSVVCLVVELAVMSVAQTDKR